MVSSGINIVGLSIKYNQQQVLDEVSFSLEPGKITALIGPNGAGKSTCMRILGGFVKPDSGHFLIDGQKKTDFQSLRENTGYLIETPDFYDYLNANDNLKLLQSIRTKENRVKELLQLVGLSDMGTKKISEFSKGMKQRLGIAQALIGNPSFLILDEPFHGLDIEVKEAMMAIVKEMAKKRHKAILISSHLLSDLEKMADNFVLLNKGIVHYIGDIHQISEQQQEVTFFFSQNISAKAVLLFPNHQLLQSNAFSFTLILTKHESELAIEVLVKNDYTPFKVEQMSSLQQKYREIAP
ncbi:MAG: ABC transporter ATP-binding protein [Bacteroidales bacterium]|nr:ABC transporter ATP-binding protein [Bacteroidales bacterium]